MHNGKSKLMNMSILKSAFLVYSLLLTGLYHHHLSFKANLAGLMVMPSVSHWPPVSPVKVDYHHALSNSTDLQSKPFPAYRTFLQIKRTYTTSISISLVLHCVP